MLTVLPSLSTVQKPPETSRQTALVASGTFTLQVHLMEACTGVSRTQHQVTQYSVVASGCTAAQTFAATSSTSSTRLLISRDAWRSGMLMDVPTVHAPRQRIPQRVTPIRREASSRASPADVDSSLALTHRIREPHKRRPECRW